MLSIPNLESDLVSDDTSDASWGDECVVCGAIVPVDDWDNHRQMCPKGRPLVGRARADSLRDKGTLSSRKIQAMYPRDRGGPVGPIRRRDPNDERPLSPRRSEVDDFPAELREMPAVDARVACQFCGRKFNHDRIQKHMAVCRNVRHRPNTVGKVNSAPDRAAYGGGRKVPGVTTSKQLSRNKPNTVSSRVNTGLNRQNTAKKGKRPNYKGSPISSERTSRDSKNESTQSKRSQRASAGKVKTRGTRPKAKQKKISLSSSKSPPRKPKPKKRPVSAGSDKPSYDAPVVSLNPTDEIKIDRSERRIKRADSISDDDVFWAHNNLGRFVSAMKQDAWLRKKILVELSELI